MAKRLYFKDYYYLQGNNVHIHGVGSLKVPTGNTSQRPDVMDGSLRFNIETNSWEFGDKNNNLIILNDNADGTSSYYPIGGGVLYGDLLLRSNSDNQILAAHGTKEKLSYTFSNDTDTGMYRSGVDTVDIVVGNEFNSDIPLMRLLREPEQATNYSQNVEVHGGLIVTGTEDADHVVEVNGGLVVNCAEGTDQVVEINGSLVVNGTMTTVNSTDLEITDNTIRLNKGGMSVGKSGIEIEADGLVATHILYDFGDKRWTTDDKLISVDTVPVLSGDLTNKNYVDGEINTLDGELTTVINDNFNTLDGKIDDEVLRATNKENKISTDLANEVLRATNKENAIANDLASEVTRSTGEEQRIETKLDDLAISTSNDIDAVNQALDDEILRATNKENSIAGDLASEISRATNKENSIASDLASEISRATNKEDTIASDLANEVLRATNKEDTIANDLASEITRSTGEEQRIETKIDNLVVSTSNDFDAVNQAISDEVLRATNKESSIASDLASEVTRSTGEEQRIETKIDDLATSTSNDIDVVNQAISDEVLRATDKEDALQQAIDTKQDTIGYTPENVSNKGQSDGYASLDGSGKVPSSELPSSVFGGIVYIGSWDAVTNTPNLQSGVGSRGEYYKVSNASDDLASNTTLDGVNDWSENDILLYNGNYWEKFDQSDKVTSVKGVANSQPKLGDVVLDLEDLGSSVYGADFSTSTDADSARTKLGLGTSATINTGTSEGEIPVRVVNGDLSGNLLGNATTASQLESSRTFTFSGDVEGSGAFDGTSNVNISIDVKNDSHSHMWKNVTSKPIGSKGEVYYFTEDGTAVEGGTILQNLRVVDSSVQLQDEKQHVTSFQDVFNNWYRFSHGSTSDIPNLKSETNAWTYDDTSDVVECTVNSSSHIGFVSEESYERYTHEVTLTSSDSDNDMLGVIIAFDFDDTDMVTNSAFGDASSQYTWDINTTDAQVPNESTLTLVRCRGKDSHLRVDGVGIQYAVVYNYNRADAKIIANGDSLIDTVTGNFSGVESSIKVVRDGDIITVYTTEWSDSTQYDGTLKGEMTIDLTSDSVLEKFRGKKSYGYSALSQPRSTYKNILFTDPTGKIYDISNNTSWYHDGTDWTEDSSNTVQTDIGTGRIIRNPEYKDLFFVDTDGSVIKIYEYSDSSDYYTKTDVSDYVNGRKWTKEVAIGSGANEVYNLGSIFGSAMTDIRSSIIDVKVLDNISGSVTNGMWIDATAVCTYGVNTSNDTLTVINEYSSSLTFYISVVI